MGREQKVNVSESSAQARRAEVKTYDTVDLVRDPGRDLAKNLGREGVPVGGHEVLRLDGTENDNLDVEEGELPSPVDDHSYMLNTPARKSCGHPEHQQP